MKEQLIKLLEDIDGESGFRLLGYHDARRIADSLIANGVTVHGIDGCEYCRGAIYTENKFKVITQMGREISVQFNFCPKCGRELPKSQMEVHQ